MLRKVLIGLLAVAMVGGLAFGLFIVGRELFLGPAEARAQGVGVRGQVASEPVVRQAGRSELVQAQGRGLRNYAQEAQVGEARGPAQERGAVGAGSAPAGELGWEEIRGIVVAYDHEMTVQTAQGEVLVGMGQISYIEAFEFQASPGDEVIVLGYQEDGEFKAGEVRNLTNGQTIVLRDASGRPVWSGQGRGKNRTSA